MHDIDLLPDMKSFLQVIYEDVERARERVMVQSYIYRDDQMGREFGELLARAAARGVETRLLYDPFGSIEANEGFFEALRGRGVEAWPYQLRRSTMWHLSLAPRNHARNIVIDGAAYTGGHAWADEWLPAERGGQGWYDVSCRVRGPVVRDFATFFERRWQDRVGDRIVDFDTEGRHQDLRLVSDSPSRESIVFLSHLDRFRRARRRIWIANAYFFPPVPMLKALMDAARRGVDVRILVPGRSDLWLLAGAARAEYLDWLAGGLRIWAYLPTVMHAKYAIVDDDWCTVGSFNANATSLLWAIELNLFMSSPDVVARLAAHFEEDLERSEQVRPDEVRDRPLLQRELDHVARLVMGLTDVALGPKWVASRGA